MKILSPEGDQASGCYHKMCSKHQVLNCMMIGLGQFNYKLVTIVFFIFPYLLIPVHLYKYVTEAE